MEKVDKKTYSPSRVFQLIEQNNLKLIEKYLENGLNPNMIRNSRKGEIHDDTSLIQHAAIHSTPEMITLLYKYGAIGNQPFESGWSNVLNQAVAADKPDNILALLEKPERLSFRFIYVHPIQQSIQRITDEKKKNLVVKALLEAGVKPYHEGCENLEPILSLACRSGFYEIAELLIDYGACVNGDIKTSYAHPLEVLLTEIAESGFPRGEGFTKKDEKTKKSYKNIIKLLLEKGADVNKRIRKRDGQPSSVLVLVDNNEILELFEDYVFKMTEESVQIFSEKRLLLLLELV